MLLVQSAFYNKICNAPGDSVELECIQMQRLESTCLVEDNVDGRAPEGRHFAAGHGGGAEKLEHLDAIAPALDHLDLHHGAGIG